LSFWTKGAFQIMKPGASNLTLKCACAWIGFLSVVLGCLILSGCTGRARESEVKAAATADAPRVISCLGRLVAGDGPLKIAGTTQAVVSELRVSRGSKIASGDILAVLQDNAAATAAIREAEEQIQVAESLLAQVKAPPTPGAIAAQDATLARQDSVLQNAEEDYRRKKLLFESKVGTAADVEAAAATFKEAQEGLRREKALLASLSEVRSADVDLAAKKLALAMATRDRALVELERTLVRAPRAGTVLEVYARQGEAISADRGLLDLGDTAHMFAEAEVYTTDFPRVHKGAQATITGDGFVGSLTGDVDEILREAGPGTLFPTDPLVAADKRVIRVRIRLDNSSKVERLSGSQVDVRIQP
jgi:HlyD family secretion protein